MSASRKETIKNIIGQIPFSAELYWLIRQRGKPIQSRFSLKNLNEKLPEIKQQVSVLREKAEPGKKVLVFASLHYWIEHAALLSMALSAQGHQVTLGYLPFSDWQTSINLFDLKRQNAYARNVLSKAAPLITPVSFLPQRQNYKKLPEDVQEIVELVSNYDSQYTLQNEYVDKDSSIYQLRLERNQQLAYIAYYWLKSHKPDVVIVPNGTIQEMGVVYRLAMLLDIPSITYEFGDQRNRIWIAQNAEVMRQETDAMWEAKNEQPLTEAQTERLKSFFSARQRADLWENFARRWQDTPTQGGEKVRKELGLDDRPIVLLATNVLGDSLTLGRQVFSESMAEWISRTVQYFLGIEEVQLVIRVHPGEVLTHGVSMLDVVESVIPELPSHIKLIKPTDKTNTYDLIEVADVGLVYTTTVGLEMALNGLPVIVAGNTHYRGRGFTLDPDSWVEYYKTLKRVMEDPREYKLTPEQVDLARQYAYRFFFEFPRPFPWHLVRMWEDYQNQPIDEVFKPENFEKYAQTFKWFLGEPMDWSKINGRVV